MPIELFFFSFLFPSYCHSVVHRVVSIVSDGCNQSFMFSCVVFESLYRCVNSVFKLASPLPPSVFDIYSLSTRGTAQVFIPLIRSLLESFVSSRFLVFLRYSFWILSLISTCLMMSASSICRFRFLRVFWSCLDLVFPFRQSYVVCQRHKKKSLGHYITSMRPLFCCELLVYFSLFVSRAEGIKWEITISFYAFITMILS